MWHTEVHVLCSCRFNSITTIHNRSLAGLKKLELLMLHSNNLHYLPDAVFADLKSLQVNNSSTRIFFLVQLSVSFHPVVKSLTNKHPHYIILLKHISELSSTNLHPACMIYELPLMSLFSGMKHTGHLTCGSNLRGRVNSAGEVILLKYQLFPSYLGQCWCHRVIIGTIFACAHNFKCNICQQLELFQKNSLHWGVDLSWNIWETQFNWISLGDVNLQS